MPYEKRIVVPGSERKPVQGARKIRPVDKDEIIDATVVLRRRQPLPPSGFSAMKTVERAEYAVIHGADPSELDKVEAFAHEHELAVSDRNPNSRTMVVSGRAEAIQNAFGTELAHCKTEDGVAYIERTGPLTVPEEIAPAVIAVLGLDSRPAAETHFRKRAAANPAGGSFTPPQVAQLYDFPTGVTGAGQTIAIIELGGGYRTPDLRTYFGDLNIPMPQVSAVSVGAGQNAPGSDADGEVMLDIEVAGAVAPGARIAVYFAENTDQGFHDAIASAVHDSVRKPSIISISWGQSEDAWTDQARAAMNAALQDAAAMGVTVTVAAGDDGASDGATDGTLHVDFPASSPFVVACGGTTLTAANGTISSEVVWNELAAQEGATGGGVSRQFDLPAYQANAGVPKNPDGNPGRGVPDVSGDADPTTGYQVRVDGQNTVIGGTSAVAPLWAALIALLNQQLGKTLGFVNPLLYQAPSSCFQDIVVGDNGGYSAGPNWDACTGQGTPIGIRLAKALLGQAAAQTAG